MHRRDRGLDADAGRAGGALTKPKWLHWWRHETNWQLRVWRLGLNYGNDAPTARHLHVTWWMKKGDDD